MNQGEGKSPILARRGAKKDSGPAMADVHHAAHVGAISKSKASPATLAGRSHASGTPADLSGTPGMKELTILVPLALAFFEGSTDSILFLSL